MKNSHRARKHAYIVGAGVTGLYLAYRYTKLGYGATIYEISPRSGGRILSSNVGPYTFNLGAGRYLPESQPLIKSLITELNLPTEPLVTQSCTCEKYRAILAKLSPQAEFGSFFSVASQTITVSECVFLAQSSGYAFILDSRCDYETGYALAASVLSTDYLTITGGMFKLIQALITACGTKLKILYGVDALSDPKIMKNPKLVLTVPLAVLINYGYVSIPSNRVNIIGRKIGYAENVQIKRIELNKDTGQLIYSDGLTQYQLWSDQTAQLVNMKLPKAPDAFKFWDSVGWLPALPLQISQVTIFSQAYTYLSNDVSNNPGWIEGSLQLVDYYLQKGQQ